VASASRLYLFIATPLTPLRFFEIFSAIFALLSVLSNLRLCFCLSLYNA